MLSLHNFIWKIGIHGLKVIESHNIIGHICGRRYGRTGRFCILQNRWCLMVINIVPWLEESKLLCDWNTWRMSWERRKMKVGIVCLRFWLCWRRMDGGDLRCVLKDGNGLVGLPIRIFGHINTWSTASCIPRHMFGLWRGEHNEMCEIIDAMWRNGRPAEGRLKFWIGGFHLFLHLISVQSFCHQSFPFLSICVNLFCQFVNFQSNIEIQTFLPWKPPRPRPLPGTGLQERFIEFTVQPAVPCGDSILLPPDSWSDRLTS